MAGSAHLLRRLYCSAATGPAPLARAIDSYASLSARSGGSSPSTASSFEPRTWVANLTSGSTAGGAIVIALARVLTAVFATAMRANHLYSAGTTYHGATAVEVRSNMSSSAAVIAPSGAVADVLRGHFPMLGGRDDPLAEAGPRRLCDRAEPAALRNPSTPTEQVCHLLFSKAAVEAS